MTARAVILDMDGLLVDTEPIYKRAWQAAADRLGFELDDESYYAFLGMGDDESEEALHRKLGPGFPLERFRSLWPTLWSEEVRLRGLTTRPGIRQLLSVLTDRTVPTAVATSSPSARAAHALQTAGIADHFSVVVSGDQVERAKPAPDLFLEAASRLEVPANDCVVLEDSDAGAQAAVAAGMRVIVIPDLRDPSSRTREIAESIHASATDALPTLRLLLEL